MRIAKVLRNPIRSDTLLQLRSTALLFINTVLAIVILVTGIYFAFFSEGDAHTPKLIILITGLVLTICGASIVAVKFTGQTDATGHFTLFWISLTYIAVVLITSGLFLSRVTPLLLIPFCMSFCVLGLRGGLFWAGAITLFFLTSIVLILSGAEFPQVIHTGTPGKNGFVIWGATLITLIAILVAYEWIIDRLLRERGGSHSNLLRRYDSGELSTIVIEKLLFEDYFSQALIRNHRFGDRMSIHFIDFQVPEIEGEANELLDEVVKEAYRRIHRLLRKTDLVARLSPSRIVITLEHLSTEKNFQGVVYNINLILSRPYELEGQTVAVENTQKHFLIPDQLEQARKSCKEMGYHLSLLDPI